MRINYNVGLFDYSLPPPPLHQHPTQDPPIPHPVLNNYTNTSSHNTSNQAPTTLVVLQKNT